MPDADPQSDADLRRQGCTWCDNVEESYTCPTCRDGRCRAPKLGDRTWRLQVTSNNYLPAVDVSGLSFSSVNDCCQLLTANLCQTWDTNCTWEYKQNARLKYRNYGLQVLTVREDWQVGVGTGGTCECVAKVDGCEYRIRYSKGCSQGYRFQIDCTLMKLYVTRTTPRYTCTPSRCQYRLALVVEGRVALAFATQTTEASSVTLLSQAGFCGSGTASPACGISGSGSYPVSEPPPWNASIVSLSPVTWRRVYRRAVDTLEFPMTFDVANDVGSACGPMCAENISESIPSISSTPPSFVCDDHPAVVTCDQCYSGSFDATRCASASVVTCKTTCDPTNSYLWGAQIQGQRNTEELRTDSGVTTSGSTPTFTIPDSFAVTLS